MTGIWKIGTIDRYFDWNDACVVFEQFHYFLCSFPVSSWSCLPSQPNALQPSCIHTRSASVPSAVARPPAAQRSIPTRRLPSPASIQPGICCATTQDWIIYRSTTLSATLNLLQHFPDWQNWSRVIWFMMTFVSEPLDSCVSVVKYKNVRAAVAHLFGWRVAKWKCWYLLYHIARTSTIHVARLCSF